MVSYPIPRPDVTKITKLQSFKNPKEQKIHQVYNLKKIKIPKRQYSRAKLRHRKKGGDLPPPT